MNSSSGLKPTKKQFEDYVAIRDSGVTNMFDVRTVCALSCTNLTMENCIYIMTYFRELAEEYDVEV